MVGQTKKENKIPNTFAAKNPKYKNTKTKQHFNYKITICTNKAFTSTN